MATTKTGIDDFKVVFSDQAGSMMENPGCADAIRETLARMRQALADVDMADREAVAEVMQSLGAIHVDAPEDDLGDIHVDADFTKDGDA